MTSLLALRIQKLLYNNFNPAMIRVEGLGYAHDACSESVGLSEDNAHRTPYM